MTERPQIFFCFPYRGVGGVSLLFMRLGEELARTGAADVTLVDYADGFMARHCDPELTQLAIYDDDLELLIPPSAVAVFQSMTPWSIFPGLRLAPDTRVLFWNCHPFNLVPTLPGIRTHMQRSPLLAKALLRTVLTRFRSKMRRFASVLLTRRSLVFMDKVNLETTENMLGIRVRDPVYLPIPAKTVPPRPPAPLKATLRIAWIGRIVDFKYFILLHALQELDRAAPGVDRPIDVTVIGSGDYRERLVTESSGLAQIRLRFSDEIAPSALDDFLREQVDLLLAMGTAALEGAKLGIPTLLLDVAYGPVPADYQFSWLHDREAGTLGDFAHLQRTPQGGDSMAARLRELTDGHEALGAAALAHFRRVHALPAVARAFTSAVASAECRWGELEAQGLTRRGLAYSLFKFLRKRFGSP